MPIDTKHPNYEKREPEIEETRDAVEGERQVKEKGDKYLVKLPDQNVNDYDDYRMRATFYPAPQRTVEALVGYLFSRPPTIEPGFEVLEDLFPSTIEHYAMDLALDLLTEGRIGTGVDSPDEGGDPFPTIHSALSIINWKVTSNRLLWAVIASKRPSNDQPDMFTHEVQDCWKLIDVSDPDNTVVTCYGQDKKPEVSVTQRPFAGGNAGNNFKIFQLGRNLNMPPHPPLFDLARMAMSYYRNSADLERGLHFVGCPQPYVTGFSASANVQLPVLTIGSTKAWTLRGNLTPGFLEFSGAGLSAIENTMANKRSIMAVLGTRLLEEPKKAVEAADTVRLRHGTEMSVLQRVATVVGAAMSWYLQRLAYWKKMRNWEKAKYTINANLTFANIDPALMNMLFSGVQSELISYETFYHNLERADMYPEGHTIKKEQKLIQKMRDTQPTPVPTVPTQTGQQSSDAVGTDDGTPSEDSVNASQ